MNACILAQYTRSCWVLRASPYASKDFRAYFRSLTITRFFGTVPAARYPLRSQVQALLFDAIFVERQITHSDISNGRRTQLRKLSDPVTVPSWRTVTISPLRAIAVMTQVRVEVPLPCTQKRREPLQVYPVGGTMLLWTFVSLMSTKREGLEVRTLFFIWCDEFIEIWARADEQVIKGRGQVFYSVNPAVRNAAPTSCHEPK